VVDGCYPILDVSWLPAVCVRGTELDLAQNFELEKVLFDPEVS
jgi:hypothetical protein